ncbi:MAG: sigma-54-dependent Fis family transcriptional regulator [Desulfobacterales bacterium]|nr:sigma-54-dependent Fis family transcriptional regulator [Desulfobacterales bacterium]
MGYRILVVDDEENMRKLLHRVLTKESYEVRMAESGSEALRLLREEEFDLIISDLVMPVLSGMDLMREAKSRQTDVQFILITAHGTIGSAVEAMKAGAFDYLTKPVGKEEILRAVHKALQFGQLRQEVRKLRAELRTRQEFKEIVFASKEMESVLKLIDKIADSQATVLILGESGTGKELVARAIHEANRQRKGPFVAVDCSALPEHLLQSELFGHVKGAFTGAVKDNKGLFLAASGGTLFLDEIGNIAPPVQLNLLRVLQEREIKPVGSVQSMRVDVRVLAATNVDLERAMREGKFRRDLYYRLSVVAVQVPPLRARRADLAPLAYHFMNKYAAAYQKQLTDISPAALSAISEYPWPGNVRELENVIERAVLLSPGPHIEEPALAFSPSALTDAGDAAPSRETLRQMSREKEKEVLLAALRQAGGNRSQAAKQLGISRSSLYNKLKELDLREADGPARPIH